MQTELTDVFALARESYSIFQAWRDLRLTGEPKASCRSPFRDERTASFSIHEDGRKWKDHGTGDGGDVADFVAAALGGNLTDAREWLQERLGIDRPPPEPPRPATGNPQSVQYPAPLIELPTPSLYTFASRRGYSQAGAWTMQKAGFLRFARVPWQGADVRCFVVREPNDRAAEIRRLDNGLFGERKAFPLRGVCKAWPIGTAAVMDSDPGQGVLIIEGATDFLTGIDLYSRFRKAGGSESWLMLGILGAMVRNLAPELLAILHCRRVRLVPDADEAGRTMGEHFRRMLPHSELIELPAGCDLTDMAKAGIDPCEIFNRGAQP